MSIKNWRLINSWWILLTFTVFFNWSAFYYIAATAKHRKWFYYGLIYTIPFLLVVLGGTESGPNYSLGYNIRMGILVVAWIISIGHAFLLRKEYLIRLETLKKVQTGTDDELRRKIEKEYGLKKPETLPKKSKVSPDINNDLKSIKTEKVENNQFESVSSRIDVNSASEVTLSELPGVSLILAKKAVQLRNSGVYFESAEDFGEALGLKPHIITRIKPLIVIIPHKETPKRKSRRIDI